MTLTPSSFIGSHTRLVNWGSPPCLTVLRNDLLDESSLSVIDTIYPRLALLTQLNHVVLLRCFNAQLSPHAGLSIWVEHTSIPSLRSLLGESLQNKKNISNIKVDVAAVSDEYDETAYMQQAERELLDLINDTTIEGVSDNSDDSHIANLRQVCNSPSLPLDTRQQGYCFTEEDVWAVLAQILFAVSYLHSSVKDVAIKDTVSASLPHGRISLDTVFYDVRTRILKLVPPQLVNIELDGTTFVEDLYAVYFICLQICSIHASEIQPATFPDYCNDFSNFNLRRYSTELKQFLLVLRSMCLCERPIVSNLLLYDKIQEVLFPLVHLEFGGHDGVAEEVQTLSPLELYKQLKQTASLPTIRYIEDPIGAERAETTLGRRTASLVDSENLVELLNTNEAQISSTSFSTPATTRDSGYPRVASLFTGTSILDTSNLDSSVSLGMSILHISSAAAGSTRLHKAVLDRDFTALGRSLENTKRFNQNGHTALMLCALNDWVDGARLLALHEGGLFTKLGETALYYALQLGHYDVAKVLTDIEGISTKNPHLDALGQTNLMRAVSANDIVAVWSWLPIQRRWKDNSGCTALMYAINSNSSLEIIKLLAPAEGGITDFTGKTALHRAAALKEIEASKIQVLLDYEKGIAYDNTNGSEPLFSSLVFPSEVAYLTENVAIFNLLFSVERDVILQTFTLESDTESESIDTHHKHLVDAVKNYSEFQVFLWISEIGNKDEHGCTALMYAAASKYFAQQTGLQRSAQHEHALCNIIGLLLEEAGMHFIGDHNPPTETTSANTTSATIAYPFNPGVTALMIAAICNDTVVIPLLIEQEAGQRDASQRTALMLAVEYKNIEAIMLLAPKEKGLTRDHAYHTSLYTAIKQESEAIAKILAPYEGYPNAHLASRLQGRYTELMHAAEEGDLVGVWSYRHQLGLQDEKGYSALMYACISGDEDCIIRLRTEEQLVAKDGTTARALAEQYLRATKPRIVDMLAIVEVVDDHGRNQLEQALVARDIKMITRFLHLSRVPKSKESLTTLMLVAELGLTEAAEIIVNEYPEQLGRTTTIYAVTRVMWEDVTALMIAAARGHDGVVAVLAQTQEVKMCDSAEGRTALMAAAINNHSSAVQLLVNAESRMQNYNGWTALMYAAAYNLTQVAEILIPTEARIQMKDGWTALMTASKNGHIAIVTLLLPYEGGLLKRSKYPSLYYAAIHKEEATVNLLLTSEQEKEYIPFILDALKKRLAVHEDTGLSNIVDFLKNIKKE